MFGLISEVSTDVLFNVVSIIIGCLVAYPLFIFINHRQNKVSDSMMKNLCFIVVSAVIGAAIPLDTYGILPIIVALYAANCKTQIILPLFVTNFIFNSTTPFIESNFTWRTGQYRVVFAVIAGIIAGLLIKIFENKMGGMFLRVKLKDFFTGLTGVKGFFKYLTTCIEGTLIFLVLGVIANSVFHRYFMYDVLKAVNASSAGASAFRYMNSFNVSNAFFVLALTLLNILMNITKLSALAFVFKIKGIVAYLIYFCAIGALLGSTIYIF
jgi:hypothetical protein